MAGGSVKLSNAKRGRRDAFPTASRKAPQWPLFQQQTASKGNTVEHFVKGLLASFA